MPPPPAWPPQVAQAVPPLQPAYGGGVYPIPAPPAWPPQAAAAAQPLPNPLGVPPVPPAPMGPQQAAFQQAVPPVPPAEVQPEAKIEQKDEEVKELKEKVRTLETIILQGAPPREANDDIFQSAPVSQHSKPWNPFETTSTTSPLQQNVNGNPPSGAGTSQRENKGGPASINHYREKEWMRDIKYFDPKRRSFSSWLVEAERKMGKDWDLDTRVEYIRSRLQSEETVKLERVLELMQIQQAPASWQVFKERMLRFFPGAIDKKMAQYRLMEQSQKDGENFDDWVDRLTKLYIETLGETPKTEVLDKLIFKGLKAEWRYEWEKRKPANFLQGTDHIRQWEASRWSELGIPNPAEAVSKTHLVHPTRAKQLPDPQSLVLNVSNEENKDSNKEAQEQPQPQMKQMGNGGRRRQKQERKLSPSKRKAEDARASPPQDRGYRGSRQVQQKLRERKNQNNNNFWQGSRGPIQRKEQYPNWGAPTSYHQPRGVRWTPRREIERVTYYKDRPVDGNQGKVRCKHCKKVGHTIQVCRALLCYICKKRGHRSEQCWYKQSAPPAAPKFRPRPMAHVVMPGPTPESQQVTPVPENALRPEQAPPSIADIAEAAQAFAEKLKGVAKPIFKKQFPFEDSYPP